MKYFLRIESEMNITEYDDVYLKKAGEHNDRKKRKPSLF